MSVVSSIVCNVGIDTLVCNKRKSVLSQSVLAVLSYIEINKNSAMARKVCIKRTSIITRSVLMKFYS